VSLVLDAGPTVAALNKADQDHDRCAALIDSAVDLMIPSPFSLRSSARRKSQRSTDDTTQSCDRALLTLDATTRLTTDNPMLDSNPPLTRVRNMERTGCWANPAFDAPALDLSGLAQEENGQPRHMSAKARPCHAGWACYRRR
jgi:hypothetical protein